jgi:protection of telomeres protein 1
MPASKILQPFKFLARHASQANWVPSSSLKQNTQDLVNLRHMLAKLWGNVEECKVRETKTKDLPNNEPPPSSEEAADETATLHVPQNKPFECCVRQFGVQVSETDEDAANAGPGTRWQRMYGLFGTKLARA